MGVVYAVEHTGLPLRYAIKVLRRRFAQRNDLAGRLRAEAQCLAHLASHPHVVRVIDTGVIDDGRVYLLMELLEGRTLREELFYHKSFSPHEACALVRQLVSALGAAHRLGVIHRDVKPSNVFLTSAGVVKLLDFGVAKVLSEGLLGAARKPMTEPGSLMGTPRYMAPEYLLGGKSADGRVDLYSAGVVLWELITGRSAFPLRDDNDQERMKVVHAIVTQGVQPLEAVGFGHVPAELRAVVRRATISDPEQRYATAEAFLADLDQVAARAASPSGRTQVLPPPSDRTQVMAPTAALGPFTSGQAPHGEETLADEGVTEPDLPLPNVSAFAPGAAPTTAHAPAMPGYPPVSAYAPPMMMAPGGASLLPSSTTPPKAPGRTMLSYQVALGIVVFSVGFLCSAAFVWNLTHRGGPGADAPHASAVASQALDPAPSPASTAPAEPPAAPPAEPPAAPPAPPAEAPPAKAEATPPPAEPAPPPAEPAPALAQAPAPPAAAQTGAAQAAPPPAEAAPPRDPPSAEAASPGPGGDRGRGKAGGKGAPDGANPSPFAPPKRKFRPGF